MTSVTNTARMPLRRAEHNQAMCNFATRAREPASRTWTILSSFAHTSAQAWPTEPAPLRKSTSHLCFAPVASQFEWVNQQIFLQWDPIEYVRVHDFQLQLLKRLTFKILSEMPMYNESPQLLEQGLRVMGELGQVGFKAPVRLLACKANEGAQSVAQELAFAANQASDRGAVTVEAAEDVLKTASQVVRRSMARRASEMLAGFSNSLVTARQGQVKPLGAAARQKSVMLLYLNEDTFHDVGNVTACLVECAMKLKLPIALVHEQDPAKGSCSFQTIIAQTPDDLLNKYCLFDTLAVPLYKAPYLREVSLRHILHCVGAKPLSQQNPLTWRRITGSNVRCKKQLALTASPAVAGGAPAIGSGRASSVAEANNIVVQVDAQGSPAANPQGSPAAAGEAPAVGYREASLVAEASDIVVQVEAQGSPAANRHGSPAMKLERPPSPRGKRRETCMEELHLSGGGTSGVGIPPSTRRIHKRSIQARLASVVPSRKSSSWAGRSSSLSAVVQQDASTPNPVRFWDRVKLAVCKETHLIDPSSSRQNAHARPQHCPERADRSEPHVLDSSLYTQ